MCRRKVRAEKKKVNRAADAIPSQLTKHSKILLDKTKRFSKEKCKLQEELLEIERLQLNENRRKENTKTLWIMKPFLLLFHPIPYVGRDSTIQYRD